MFCLPVFKPGAHPQPDKWVHAWFMKLFYKSVCICVCIAKWQEHQPVNQKVASSMPGHATLVLFPLSKKFYSHGKQEVLK